MNIQIVNEMDNGNKILGNKPMTQNSTISFKGSNNILYCEDNVKLTDSCLEFNGNNSIVYLCSNRNQYKLFVSIYNDSVFHVGRNNYINRPMRVILSEQKHCFIGDNGAFSYNITIRNSDPHLIYNCSTKKRINMSKSIYIGDHVWVGQDARLLKGTQIDSGSIIGAMSVVPGKRIPHNTTWAGNPCKQISDDIFWDFSCVHDWTLEKTIKSMQFSDYLSEYKPGYHDDYWIYEYAQEECLEWNELEKHFSENTTSMHKCEYLIQLNDTKNKNRFVHI